MKIQQSFAAALFALASASAIAASPEFLTTAEPSASTLTRADVIAQVAQARAQGTLSMGSNADFTPVLQDTRSMDASARSRDDVRREAVAAVKRRYDASTTFMQ